MSLWVVVGGQYGSEGKGKVAAFITKQEDIDICVRCGGPNSGHSFVDDNGKTIILRQLPTGYVNDGTRLLIPAGALIDPIILKKEIETLAISPKRIGIDPKCFVIEEKDREAERSLGLRERISSTLCGVGGAVSRRALRGDDARLVKDVIGTFPWLEELMVDRGVSAEVNAALDNEKKVLVEGTQGFGLSLYHSEHYPHCTSRDTTASGFLSEVGVSPRMVTEVILVLRTFPIRVAGQQAGFLRDEITWEQIRAESCYPFEIEERTSVTRMVRRVGRFDWELARGAVVLNRPTRIAINGLDYVNFSDFGALQEETLSTKSRNFLGQVVREFGAPIGYLGVGPSLGQIICRPIPKEAIVGQSERLIYSTKSQNAR